MSERPVIAYDRAPDKRNVIDVDDDTAILDVSPKGSIWPLIIYPLLGIGGAALIWNGWSSRRPVGEQILNALPLAIPILMMAFVWASATFGVRRAILRPHAGGFVLEQSGWRKRRVLDVAWHEVGGVSIVNGPKPAFQKRPCWVQISLLNTSPAEVVPLDLMRGRSVDEVFRAAGVVERWWQNAAAGRRPPE